jgi:hypothetical protein
MDFGMATGSPLMISTDEEVDKGEEDEGREDDSGAEDNGSTNKDNDC